MAHGIYFKQHYGNDTQQQVTWRSHRRYLSSHSGPSLPNHSRSASISNDLDDTEDDVLWADTNSKEEDDDMYDEMVTHKQIQRMFSEEWWWILGFWVNIAKFSASYRRVWLKGSVLVLKRCILYTSIYNMYYNLLLV